MLLSNLYFSVQQLRGRFAGEKLLDPDPDTEISIPLLISKVADNITGISRKPKLVGSGTST